MAHWWRNKGNYLRRSNIEAFAQADMNIENTQSVEKSISKRKEKVTRQRELEARNKQAQASKARMIQMLRESRL